MIATPVHPHHGRLRRVRLIAAAGVALSCAVLVIGSIGAITVGDGPAAGATTTVVVTDRLQPSSVTVNPGTTVTWRNDDSDRHEFRSTSGPARFETGDLEPGESGSVVFRTVGVYQYHDHRNNDSSAYQGTVIVREGTTSTTGSGGTNPTTPPPPMTARVTMAGETFRPGSVTIGVGGTVEFVNDDDRPHTVTSTSGAFDSGPMSSGARYQRRFDSAGTYNYVCDFHGNMRGTVTVVATGSTTPTTGPGGGGTTTTAAPGPTTTTSPPPPGAAQVAIRGSAFSPGSVRIRPGGSVTWTNDDSVMHTVTANDASFDSSFLARDAHWTHRFDSPGSYDYYCTLHPEMRGSVIVTTPSGAPPPPGSGTGGVRPPSGGGGGSGGSGLPPGVIGGSGGAAGRALVVLADNRFDPTQITVGAGAVVTFENRGAVPHTATGAGGAFATGTVMPGDAVAVTLDTPGNYSVSCDFHAEMRALIVVDEQAADPGAVAGAGGPIPSGRDPNATPGDAASPGGSATADNETAPVEVSVVDNRFDPLTARLPVGGTVHWSLDGIAPHSITADDGSFDSGILQPGDEYSRTFDEVGEFGVHCVLHPGMIGTVKVVPADQFAAGANSGSMSAPSRFDSRQRMLIGIGAAGALLFGVVLLFATTKGFIHELELSADRDMIHGAV
jgi:plastocyanin